MTISYSALVLRAKLGALEFTAAQAKREAMSCLRDNRRINDCEFAYSPLTGAVGCRWTEDSIFRVFNVRYPMYGQNEEITDWMSVGKGIKTN
jgi:hypothetical protein